MKTTKAKATKTKISSEIDLELSDSLTTKSKNKIKQDVGELLVDTILGDVGQAKSPIRGAFWPALSKKYKDFKRKEGRGSKANMEFSGAMLDALGFKSTDLGVSLQIKGPNASKADGHNNFSGKSSLPTRQFMPKPGDKFSNTLERNIKSIISEHTILQNKIKKSDLNGIETKFLLNQFIREEFSTLSLTEAKDAILLDDELRDLFGDLILLF